MIDQNCTMAFAFTRHIKREYPEFIAQIQSKSARRLLLNHERALIWKMEHEGVLETAEAQHLIDNIDIHANSYNRCTALFGLSPVVAGVGRPG
jgi:hypothetical protein